MLEFGNGKSGLCRDFFDRSSGVDPVHGGEHIRFAAALNVPDNTQLDLLWNQRCDKHRVVSVIGSVEYKQSARF